MPYPKSCHPPDHWCGAWRGRNTGPPWTFSVAGPAAVGWIPLSSPSARTQSMLSKQNLYLKSETNSYEQQYSLSPWLQFGHLCVPCIGPTSDLLCLGFDLCPAPKQKLLSQKTPAIPHLHNRSDVLVQ